MNSREKRLYAETTDWGLVADAGLRPCHVALCLLLALSASDPNIFECLPGLMPGQLEMLRNNKLISDRQKDFRERFLGEAAAEKFTRFLPRAFDIMTEVLQDKSGDMKLKDRFEAAKWLFEKTTGKARQEIEISGGMTIRNLIAAIDAQDAAAPLVAGHGAILPPGPGQSSRDVTPKRDPLREWVDKFVTVVPNEKG